MQKVGRFLAASLASALSVVIFLSITIPLYTLAHGTETLSSSIAENGILATLGVGLFLLPFVLMIGGPIAIAAAVLLGGALLALRAHLPIFDTRWTWALIGMLAGVIVSLFFGIADPVWPARIATALWFALSGGIGAVAFWRIWFGKTRVPSQSP